jgi:MarR family transcriptional regulator for hemolysin
LARSDPGTKRIEIECFDLNPLVMAPPPEEEPIGLFVARSARSVSRAFESSLVDQEGSLASWLVLASLAGGLHRSQRSIASAVGVEGSTLTHHLNRLQTAGLVTRERDPQNRRVHQVALTAEGRARFRSLLGTVQAFDRRLRAGLTPEELATLRQLLQRLADSAEDADKMRTRQERGTLP